MDASSVCGNPEYMCFLFFMQTEPLRNVPRRFMDRLFKTREACFVGPIVGAPQVPMLTNT